MYALLKYSFASRPEISRAVVLDDNEENLDALERELEVLLRVRLDFLYVLVRTETMLSTQVVRQHITDVVNARPRPEFAMAKSAKSKLKRGSGK